MCNITLPDKELLMKRFEAIHTVGRATLKLAEALQKTTVEIHHCNFLLDPDQQTPAINVGHTYEEITELVNKKLEEHVKEHATPGSFSFIDKPN